MPILISTRAVGWRDPLVPDWQIPEGPGLPPEGEPLTLRELIRRVVYEEIRAFLTRQRDHRFIRVLTERQIAEGIARGHVVPGGRDFEQPVDEDTVVATAWQAFEDGLYLVVLDGEEQRDLDQQVWLRPDSQLVFIRLTMLAGA